MPDSFVGLDTFLAYSSTAGATPANFGRIESAELNPDNPMEHLTGAGGDDSIVYGMIGPAGNGSMWLQSITPLNHLQKTVVNGLPTVIGALDGGAVGTGGKVGRQTSCYVNTWKLGLEKGGAVKLDFDWLALTHTTSALTTAPASLAKNLILEWVKAAVTFGGVAFNCQSVAVSGENGLKLDTDIDAKTSGTERNPTNIKPGNSKISVEADFACFPTVDPWVTAPATVQLVWSAKNTEGTPKTLLVTVSNIRVNNAPIPIAAGDDEVVYKITGELEYNDLTSCTWSLA